MDHSFPKLARLRKSWEYQQVWKMGCKLHTPHFILLLVKNNLSRSRLGLTVSRKVGNAIMRNHLKRQVRTFFRLNCTDFTVSVDLSVVAKRGAATLGNAACQTELRRALDYKGHLDG